MIDKELAAMLDALLFSWVRDGWMDGFDGRLSRESKLDRVTLKVLSER